VHLLLSRPVLERPPCECDSFDVRPYKYQDSVGHSQGELIDIRVDDGPARA
jgi:hypothetical protein